VTVLALLVAAAITSAEIVCEADRPPQPDGLSGITRAGSGDWLAVDDTGGLLFTLRADIDRTTGNVSNVVVTNKVALAGVIDAEGVAWDPLRHTVWVADEKGSRISEHDPKSGKRLSDVRMPSHFARARLDREIESLAIAPNGLEMWTATEEAVEGDGGIATRATGSVVRLQRFSRMDGKVPWKASGQFAYVVDPMGGEPFRKDSRSGLSDLCVLPGGELLALEREFSQKGLLPTFRMRIYVVDLRKATDVGTVDKLEGTRFTPVVKRSLLDANTGFAMYEGLCLGPRLTDGSQVLLFISDGDDLPIETLMSVRLR